MFRLTVALCVLYFAAGARAASKEETNDDRVVGGYRASIEDHCYQISLLRDGTHFCGGSLVAPDIVVTAAHCMEGLENIIPRLDVSLGSANWTPYGGGVRRKIKAFASHPSWTRQQMNFDLSIIQLDRPVVYSSRICQIALCSRAPQDGGICHLSGFGYRRDKANVVSDDLYGVDLTFVSNQRCASRQFAYGPGAILSTMICAEGQGEGSCQGDSGGPLVDRAQHCLAGIVSWGADCAAPGHPGVYCNAAMLKGWTEQTIQYLRRF